MYEKRDSYRNYHSHSKVITSQYSKIYGQQSPRKNTQNTAFNNFVIKNKSKSDINNVLSNKTFRTKVSTLNIASLKQKSYHLRTEKSQMSGQKQRAVGINLQNYKIKKLEQRIKEPLHTQKGKYHLPESPSSRYMPSQCQPKKVLSARKPSPIHNQGAKGKVHPQNTKHVNLQLDSMNFKDFFNNKRLPSHIPQTTKSILQYNKIIKKNQMALKPFEETKLVFKKLRQVQTLKQSREHKQKCQSYHLQQNNLSPRGIRHNQKQCQTIPRILFKKQKPQPLSINDFVKYRQLGKGQNGKIYSAFHKKTGVIVALKHFQQNKIIIDYLVDQMKIQLFSSHRNILAAYGYIIQKYSPIQTNRKFLNNDQSSNQSFYNIHIIMQKGQFNLFTLIKKQKQLSQQEASTYTEQILNGLKYLHQHKIIHRDLKPQNIILVNGVCKITDFGWSVIGSDERQTFCGTLEYVSPQVAVGAKYDNKIDAWSVGVLIYEMITGEAPYDTSNILQNPIEQYRKRILTRLSKNVSCQCKQLLSKLLKIDPKQRISVEEALNHKWIKDLPKRKTLRKDISTIKQQFERILNQH